MTTNEPTTQEQISAGCMRMLELFAAICGDPDNAELARQADSELAKLDTVMRAA